MHYLLAKSVNLCNICLLKVSEYMYVGGMPAVVKAFIENGNLHEMRKEQEKILNNYKEDFSKQHFMKATRWYSKSLKEL